MFVIGVTLGLVVGGSGGVFGLLRFGPALRVDGPPAPTFALDAGPIATTPASAARSRLMPKPAESGPGPAAAMTMAPAGPPQTIEAPVGGKTVIGVFGDSLGDGLWAGVYRRLSADKRFTVSRFSQASTGLSRYDYVNLQQKTAEQLAGKHIDVAVVLFGANDEQAIAQGGKIQPFGSDGWKAIYGQRIGELVTLLRAHGAAVYWVGLPKMKGRDYDARAGVLNAVYEAQAKALGVPFVPTVPVTVNAEGGYDDYLAADGGRPVLMRARDGIHMTMAGYIRLAGPITARLVQDVARATAAAPGAVSTVASAGPGGAAGQP